MQLVLHIDDGQEDQTRHHGDDGPCQVTHVRLLHWRNAHYPNCPGRRDLSIPAHGSRRKESVTIARALADLGKGRAFGEVATEGDAERAVLKLITGRSQAGTAPERGAPSTSAR